MSRPAQSWMRRRRVLAAAAGPMGRVVTAGPMGRAVVATQASGHSSGRTAPAPAASRSHALAARLQTLTARLAAGPARLWHDAQRSPGRTVVAAVVSGGLLAGWFGGVVAGLVIAAYVWLGVRALLASRGAHRRQALRVRQLDALAALAADLRAGLPTGQPALPGSAGESADGRLDRLATAAVRLAERTGAPLAELIERIETDARALDRAREAAAAQAAGSRVTAWLLAGLPAGGIALGYGIGVDPLAVLLRTPIGAACALGAVALQITGLIWTERLNKAPEGAG
ncbi:type II secretion system F family protein [Micromonospora sp. NBC_01813]|uniref:type II secretion system F family protein n=1 Tax=Micromonospora sp. NBC_01813 TaxID=2975988 RepID=UPI002DDBF168|nr:hypothetical protein [Micromonospora sp. NBC_01813]WSA07917.1 hypothetical protein OG958_27455 [Micromonospora sp. NBC_01813]